MTVKKDLMAMKKDITAIGRKLEKLIKAVEKSEKAKVTKAKAMKAKPAKKAPKAPAKKKTAKVTATNQVLNIINRSKKGVDTATLMNKTGFDEKKIRNIVFRTMKEGKIKRADKGIYVGVK